MSENTPPDGETTLGDVERHYPGWRAWRGVNHRCYARLPGTSPPMVVSAATPAGLLAEIEAAIREREWPPPVVTLRLAGEQ